MGCVFSSLFPVKRDDKPSDSASDEGDSSSPLLCMEPTPGIVRANADSSPLLCLEPTSGAVRGNVGRQHNSHTTLTDNAMARVNLILSGVTEQVQQINQEIDVRRRQGADIVNRIGNRQLSVEEKAELAGLYFQVKLQSSLLRNLMQKEKMLLVIATTARLHHTNSMIAAQLKDSKISDFIRGTEMKPEDETKDFQKSFDLLSNALERLEENEDTAGIVENEVTIPSAESSSNEDELRRFFATGPSIRPTPVASSVSAAISTSTSTPPVPFVSVLPVSSVSAPKFSDPILSTPNFSVPNFSVPNFSALAVSVSSISPPVSISSPAASSTSTSTSTPIPVVRTRTPVSVEPLPVVSYPRKDVLPGSRQASQPRGKRESSNVISDPS